MIGERVQFLASDVAVNREEALLSTAEQFRPLPTVDIEERQAEGKKQLSDDVRNIIGRRIAEERIMAPPVHSDFAIRVGDILKLGLPTEEKRL